MLLYYVLVYSAVLCAYLKFGLSRRTRGILGLIAARLIDPNFNRVDNGGGRGKQLAKRSEDPITAWQSAVYIGEWLICIMNASSGTIKQSLWTHFTDLQDNDWRIDTYSQATILPQAFRDLHVSTSEVDWKTVHVEHGTTRTRTLMDKRSSFQRRRVRIPTSTTSAMASSSQIRIAVPAT